MQFNLQLVSTINNVISPDSSSTDRNALWTLLLCTTSLVVCFDDLLFGTLEFLMCGIKVDLHPSTLSQCRQALIYTSTLKRNF